MTGTSSVDEPPVDGPPANRRPAPPHAWSRAAAQGPPGPPGPSGPSGPPGPLRRPRGRGAALLRPLGAAGAVAAAALVVAFVDPSEPGHYPTCPFLFLTGWYCPGCGGLRMAHSLMHGDVAAAFGLNPLAMLLLPFVVYLWVRWAVSAAKGVPLRSVLLRPPVMYSFVGVLGAYWIIRNLPFAQVLAP